MSVTATCPDMYNTPYYYKPTKYHKYGYSLLLFFSLVVAPSDMLLFDIALNPDTGVLSFLKIPM